MKISQWIAQAQRPSNLSVQASSQMKTRSLVSLIFLILMLSLIGISTVQLISTISDIKMSLQRLGNMQQINTERLTVIMENSSSMINTTDSTTMSSTN